MATTISIPIEIFEILERKLGREDAKEVIKVIEKSLETIDAKAEEAKTEVKRLSEDLALQKKLELKDELTKELATKSDILLVRQEMQTIKVELEGKIESLNTKLNFLIFLMIIALTLMNPVMADIIKSFLK
ncbi:MAG: hypothetical protein A3I04_01620 [Nitrospinae bacterium RIFCSPLOWO2_02_FULL_39_110]|nr:MAG: hypothetical protein A2W53_04740 [Nitrospinae bacterium RIFCSPHIGHO2_02_39_11]OGW03699.1 MAG: hypothetical protein A2Z59_04615 [Nitrospinae bacterium RIFCSPLOWO2_02_39_17]OGW04044.1 MAG: hypothetical protein A3I04_01620 [Nitrospinae bacterium RIFCSPLOWO2_02_FULL_39_110]OGW08397.1 MAG: hypothetical protein A2W75_03220 [Nitrospinae bacterium RIFCSPLOWO2_12_39_15]